MKKQILTIALNLMLILTACPAVMAKAIRPINPVEKKPLLLIDSMSIENTPVILTKNDGSWLCEIEEPITDGKTTLEKGTTINTLPSNTLEKMISTADTNKPANFYIWATITKYKDKNYIFPAYFIPLTVENPNITAFKETLAPKEMPREKLWKESVEIPEDVKKMLNPEKVVNLAQLKKAITAKKDFLLISRTGFIKKTKQGSFIFSLDAIGQNIQDMDFEILPNQILENIESKNSNFPSPKRYDISGLITNFNNTHYLLLQNASIAYSQGNFPR